ncbi:MAG TPA: hypothetical protein VFG53_04435 [Anaeromyxobacter sp.]|nr:hypothetical protein [Anaeromyxobacter sp.]
MVGIGEFTAGEDRAILAVGQSAKEWVVDPSGNAVARAPGLAPAFPR